MTSEGRHGNGSAVCPAGLSHAEIVAFVDLMTEGDRPGARPWERVCDTDEEIDVELELNRLTFQIVAQCLFGMDLSDDGADVALPSPA